MLSNLLMGLVVMGIGLITQSLLLLVVLRYYKAQKAKVNSKSFLASALVINGVMTLLVLGNLGQIGIWALVFQYLGEFTEFQEAFYHSMVNFATLGYGDFVMSAEHKLLGPLEAINGVLMIGMSTAVLMTVFQDAYRKTLLVRQGDDAHEEL